MQTKLVLNEVMLYKTCLFHSFLSIEGYQKYFYFLFLFFHIFIYNLEILKAKTFKLFLMLIIFKFLFLSLFTHCENILWFIFIEWSQL